MVILLNIRPNMKKVKTSKSTQNKKGYHFLYIEQAMLIHQNNTDISKYSDSRKLMNKDTEQ